MEATARLVDKITEQLSAAVDNQKYIALCELKQRLIDADHSDPEEIRFRLEQKINSTGFQSKLLELFNDILQLEPQTGGFGFQKPSEERTTVPIGPGTTSGTIRTSNEKKRKTPQVTESNFKPTSSIRTNEFDDLLNEPSTLNMSAKDRFQSKCKFDSELMSYSQTQGENIYEVASNIQNPDPWTKPKTADKQAKFSESEEEDLQTMKVSKIKLVVTQDLFNMMHSFLMDEINKPSANGPIELIGSQRTPEWFKARRLRITASNFGVVFKRRSFDPPQLLEKFVANLLNPKEYSGGGGIPALKYGQDMEPTAREAYEKATGNIVSETGFWTNSKCMWLGGSPDGIVTCKSGQKGLLEIKCPYSARTESIDEFMGRKDCYLQFGGLDGLVHLNQSHNYYYQIQGCLHILDYDWCDFVVYTPVDLHVERITKNPSFIATMVKRLKEFYIRFILPSLTMGEAGQPTEEYLMIHKSVYDEKYTQLINL